MNIRLWSHAEPTFTNEKIIRKDVISKLPELKSKKKALREVVLAIKKINAEYLEKRSGRGVFWLYVENIDFKTTSVVAAELVAKYYANLGFDFSMHCDSERTKKHWTIFYLDGKNPEHERKIVAYKYTMRHKNQDEGQYDVINITTDEGNPKRSYEGELLIGKIVRII